MDEQETPTHKRTGIWIAGAILLLVLLMGAAFIGGQLLAEREKGLVEQGLLSSFIPSPDLPNAPPEMVGMVTAWNGGSLTVQEFTVNESMASGVASGGVAIVESSTGMEGVTEIEEGSSASPDFIIGESEIGPEIEVVISKDTKIFKDTTMAGIEPVIMSVSEPGQIIESAPMLETIQQVVEPGDADEIGPGSFITIWGERRGDRIEAHVILYQPPITFDLQVVP